MGQDLDRDAARASRPMPHSFARASAFAAGSRNGQTRTPRRRHDAAFKVPLREDLGHRPTLLQADGLKSGVMPPHSKAPFGRCFARSEQKLCGIGRDARETESIWKSRCQLPVPAQKEAR